MVKQAQRLQLYHHDNGDLEFIKRRIVGESVAQYDETDNPTAAWIDFYETLYPFNGYGGVGADAVQLAYGRHFHLEVHDILDDEKRPPDSDVVDNDYISGIADARGMELVKNIKPKTVYEKMTILLGSALILEILIWGVALAIKFSGN